MKTAKIKLSDSQKRKVNRALENHERLKNSYFWTSSGNAADRRARERKYSFSVSFINAGNRYEYTSAVTISTMNVYYYGKFLLNGEKKNVRLFKTLIT